MEPSKKFHESFKEGFVPGYVFVTTFFIIICISYWLPPLAQLVKNRKANQKRKLSHEVDDRLKQEKIKEAKRKRARRMKKELPMELLERRIQIYEVGWLSCTSSFTKLCDATEHFSEGSAIGVGRTGIMYKATLPNGYLVAVKRLYDSELLMQRFKIEITMGRYSHRNIIPPIGYYIDREKKERILVYRYMSKGKLSDWLNDTTTTLGWTAVIRIALGVARGLSCLHHSLHVIHHCIASESILLGNNFEPRISNFGRAIFINYDLSKSFGFKKDVYDFGTLLFKLIGGRTFGKTSKCFSNTNNNGPFATYTYATNMFEDPFGFYEAVDKSLNEIEFEDEVSALLRVACDCVHPFPHKRPTMLEVYSKMSNVWERDVIF